MYLTTIYQLLRELPKNCNSSKRLQDLLNTEAGLPLHKRKFFGGLPGDYRINDENGRECWASELAHRYFVETCPRGLKRRSKR